MIEILLGALVGGVGFRIRGWSGFEKLIGRGATTARILAWASPLGLLSLALAPWWGALAIGGGLFAGSVAPWWGSIDMGRDRGAWLRDAAWQTLRGLIWVAPAAVAVFLVHGLWWVVLLAGLTCAPAYEIGWRLRPHHGGSELGEIIFGACIGAALMGALLAV